MSEPAMVEELTRPPRRFRSYSQYRDSGVEWLGEVPAHWETMAFRRSILGIEQGWSPVAEDREAASDEWAVIKLSAVSRGRFRGGEHKTLLPDLPPDTRYEIREGDLLLTRANTPDLVGDVCVARGVRPKLMLCDLVYRVNVRKDRVSPTFVAYWLASRVGRHQIEVDARGSSRSMVKVSQGHIRAWTLVVPPQQEQHAVTAFLDRETARIDTLVAKKERLIELLQEKRAALVTRAVTRGLEPKVPMKDSGVEWLGEVPVHWEVKPLKHEANFINGFAFKPDEWGAEGIPIIRIANLNGGEDFNHTMRQLPDRYCAGKGDLLFGWSGNRGTSFGPFLWWRDGKHYVNQHIFRVVDFDVDKMWLYWVLRAVTVYVEKQAHGIIGMVHVTRGELGIIPIPVVPASEQIEIASFVGLKFAEFDALITKIRTAISHLHELRTALISAAVTGKIDVREEAA